MPDVQTYRVTAAATSEQATPQGLVTLTFKAGDHTPESPAEAAALQALVAAGAAHIVEADKASRPTKAPTKAEE